MTSNFEWQIMFNELELIREHTLTLLNGAISSRDGKRKETMFENDALTMFDPYPELLPSWRAQKDIKFGE